ncbi:MAG: glycoside hydrolase family 19 [Flavipsychrobacter sp.]|nr:glycoside hydrolase family 19 [Flavipsychrobacter sp.]
MDYAKLKGVIPDSIIAQLPALAKFGIDGPKRLSHLLGQCMHESANFKLLEENLNYSADGLLKTFSKYFSAADAAKYARKPEMIANRVYSSRMGNGPEASGDGWKYRGRGAVQLTGKDAYNQLTAAVGVPGVDFVKTPELVNPGYSLISAANFFKSKPNMWATCDKGVDDATITAVTKRVNGGTNGLEERKKYTKQVYALISA